jgi:penicillin-binding protein 1A
MSEDDRRQSYEDAPIAGDAHDAAPPMAESLAAPPVPDQPSSEPAQRLGQLEMYPPAPDAHVEAADLAGDAGSPGAPDHVAAPGDAWHGANALAGTGGNGRVVTLDLPDAPRRKPRLKKLRLLILLLPFGVLAIVSAVFGMIMAISSDLPALENRAEYKAAKNSILLDVTGRQIGVLTGQDNRILVSSQSIPFIMKRAIVSVEDKRFYTNSGIDIKGIGRAFVADIFKQRAAQGASTITQQFVKNALQAQNKRTVFEKLREAALAYHLTRKWSKDKILTEYLNSIYFGNGAYGIESAARTYFGHDPSTSQFDCGITGRPLCVPTLTPDEAALLAGVVASPTAYDPVGHARAALLRRNIVLSDMLAQGYLTQAEYQDAVGRALPARQYIIPPQAKVIDPGVAYFTTWIQQQLVDRYKVPQAFDGGLVVHTTLDYQLQQEAERAVRGYLADPSGPQAALVAIDNKTGEVRALVGGNDYNTTPFNLATQGQRQPGSAFKPFVLAQALKEGISPDSVWPSEKRTFVVPHTRGQEHFVVNNYESAYAGSRTLGDALRVSDNSVFAAVGIQAGTKKIAALAAAAGIRTPVSTNYAITLGGLHRGVTVLDMAHAYETIAHDGQRVYGTLGAPMQGPVGIHSVSVPGQRHPDLNKVELRRVLPSAVDQEEQSLMHNVVTSGTGKAADPGVWAAGKTGTTENYGDAWFVGFTRRLTIAVWVGYPDRLRSMATDFAGSPVAGGTFPALIWHDFVVAANTTYDSRAASAAAKSGQSQTSSTTATDTGGGVGGGGGGTSSTPTGNGGAPTTTTKQTQTPGAYPQQTPATTTPAAAGTPDQTQQAAPTPTPTPAPTPGTQAAPPASAAPVDPSAGGTAGASGGAQGPSG